MILTLKIVSKTSLYKQIRVLATCVMAIMMLERSYRPLSLVMVDTIIQPLRKLVKNLYCQPSCQIFHLSCAETAKL